MNAQASVRHPGGSQVQAWTPPTRLAFPDRVGDRFQLDAIKWKALVETIYPNATSVDSVVMALSYCEARKLDPFKRPVHIVPIWSKPLGKMVDSVWPGISEIRTTAMRTGVYAGKDKTVFGPDVTTTLGGVEVTYPEWAQMTVYRVVPGVGRCAFEGPEVSWIETYARAGRDTDKPNDMWSKRPRGQLDKCAEAAALRGAFPEELGNEYAAEEVEGQAFGAGRMQAEPAAPVIRQLHSGFETDHIPDFDAPRPQDPASEQPASDETPNSLTDAGDQFPGDAPSSGEKAAAPVESEGAGVAADVLTRADRALAELPFMGLSDLKQLQANRSFKALLVAIRAQDPTKADQVEKALADALESFG